MAPGALAFNDVCDIGQFGRECAAGVCDAGFANRCTAACRPGPDGDRACQAYVAGSHCVATVHPEGGSGGTPAGFATLGVCRRECQRDADCAAAAQICVARPNALDDRFDFVCATRATFSFLTGLGCPAPPQACASGLCADVTGRGALCSAPCVSDSDCPAEASRCENVSARSPVRGVPLAVRGCVPPH